MILLPLLPSGPGGVRGIATHRARAPHFHGGERGTRNLGTVSRTHAFQACTFSHSVISPRRLPPDGTGGEGGIRTHVPGHPDKALSRRPRYGHFGTSP